ncbi:MAG: hypothetical protein CM15mP125_2980 [Gammaproteobacteria bacterium]|nr:MAG: hypothetical protein CM15mP125_2980 [Gammaproteobacteria bacterium]
MWAQLTPEMIYSASQVALVELLSRAAPLPQTITIYFRMSSKMQSISKSKPRKLSAAELCSQEGLCHLVRKTEVSRQVRLFNVRKL